MNPQLAGRRLFVTGAAAGIGRACVERFLAEGARVACFDRDAAALSRLGEELPGDSLALFTGDVTSVGEVEAALAGAAEALQGLDGLVNSAGVDLLASLTDTEDAAWRRVFSVNLDGPMHVCRAGLPHLKAAGGGTIVNISSGAGLRPLMHRTAYSASKAGLQMFSKALAIEAAEWSIRVNAVCPGAVDTGLFHSVLDPDDPQELESVRARYLLHRIAQPEEIAAAVLWLTSAESSFVTGSIVAVDGGRTFH